MVALAFFTYCSLLSQSVQCSKRCDNYGYDTIGDVVRVELNNIAPTGMSQRRILSVVIYFKEFYSIVSLNLHSELKERETINRWLYLWNYNFIHVQAMQSFQ